ncbi:DUF1674 domain-containing protein [Lysobacter korlensis]|uniref:DUF1674 domain-containing protein n=1 Tax=Lysobacter korlensis TaxID=553636 RepID=A0ABV6RL48_9GAMM
MIGETPEDAADPDDAGKRVPEPQPAPAQDAPPKEIGGRDGPEPTRYGDWEKNGRCIDF